MRSDIDSKSSLSADYSRDFVTGDSPFAITDIVMSSDGGIIGSVLVLNIGESAAGGRKMALYGYDKFSKTCVLLCNPVNVN